MINIINADIFTTNARVVCHQVNCIGFMGAGIAKQIKHRFPEAYKEYRQHCDLYSPEDLIGTVQLVFVKDKIIANLFGQINCGKNKGQHTSYEAIRKGFSELDKYAEMNNCEIALPYGIGCGLGGGDWDTVYKIIEECFINCNVLLYKYINKF